MSDVITEIIEVRNINVYNKNCNGCVRHKKDIMMIINKEDEAFDTFLTNEQAEKLIVDLTEKLMENKKEKK
jgi:hypothetical protein